MPGYNFQIAPDLLESLADHMVSDEPSPMLMRTEKGIELRWNSMTVVYLRHGVRIDLQFNGRTIAYMRVPLGEGDTLNLQDLGGGLAFHLNATDVGAL
jgi:hypothetical protein